MARAETFCVCPACPAAAPAGGSKSSSGGCSGGSRGEKPSLKSKEGSWLFRRSEDDTALLARGRAPGRRAGTRARSSGTAHRRAALRFGRKRNGREALASSLINSLVKAPLLLQAVLQEEL